MPWQHLLFLLVRNITSDIVSVAFEGTLVQNQKIKVRVSSTLLLEQRTVYLRHIIRFSKHVCFFSSTIKHDCSNNNIANQSHDPNQNDALHVLFSSLINS